MSALPTIKKMTALLRSVLEYDGEFPNIIVLSKYRKALEEKYAPKGTHTHLLLLYDDEINKLVLNTTIDLSNCTLEDVTSKEFDELINVFTLCIGKSFASYRKISNDFSKSDVISVISKVLTLEI